MKGILKIVVWIGFAAAAAYAGYSWYSYSGPYRLIAEWQIETFGSFSVKLTLLGVILALMMPVAIVGHLLGGPNLMKEPDGLARAKSSPGLMALLGLLLLGPALLQAGSVIRNRKKRSHTSPSISRPDNCHLHSMSC